ncbi:MAG: SpoIVB peptidase S55 domain-containing protein [Acidobacteriota bacterium]
MPCRRLIVVALLGAVWSFGAGNRPLRAAPETAIMAFSDVSVGMKGIGKTVFAGASVDDFDVEVIAKMHNILPDKNLIVARLKGGPLAETGILEGMSGSPVFIDGRLVGAISYSWSFAKEPICGITPIEEMLELLDRSPAPSETTGTISRGSLRSGPPGDPSLLFRPDRVADFLRDGQRRLLSSASPLAGSLQPMRPALAFGGYSPAIIRQWFPALATAPFHPVITTGSAGRKDRAGGDEASSLQPGSAFAVSLVRGDLDISAIGTVTYADGSRILGFGHPFLGMGRTTMPMMTARVHSYLPSLASSFKLASPMREVGAITQDRFVGVMGVRGMSVQMIPVRIEIEQATGGSTSYSFEIVPDPLLTPGLLNLSLLNLLSSQEKLVGDLTLRLREGSHIQIAGGLDVKIDNLFSGEYSALYASGTIAYMTYLLMNNDDRAAAIEGINLLIRYEERRRVANIEKIWLDRYSVAPGQTLPLHVDLRPYRGERFTVEVPLKIPAEAQEGKVLLQVGDALTLSRMESGSNPRQFFPRNLEHMVWLLNHIRSNQKIYATLIRPDNGAMIAGQRLPSLPPSISSVLLRPGMEPNNTSRVRVRSVLEENKETAHVIRGYQKTILEIRR